MNSQRSLREILEIVLGRRYLVAGITLAVFFAGAVVSFALPRQYESFTKVRVVDNMYLYGVYGRKLVGAKSGTERIRAIQQEVLSRISMADLVEHLNLDRDFAGLPERERLERMETLILDLQKRTTVDLKETTRGEFIFSIAHECPDAARAQRIVTHLSTGYQDRQYSDRKTQASGTLKAVQQKVSGVERDHRLAADELASFEESHPDHRFGRPDDTRARLEVADGKLQDLLIEIQGLEMKLANIDEQLAEEPEFIELPEKMGNELEVERLKEKLDQLEEQLLLLLERYTEEHPEVQAKKKQVQSYREKLEKAKATHRTVMRKMPNPVYAELKKSRLEALFELTVKKQLQADYELRVAGLKALFLAFPELSSRWKELTERKKDLKDQLTALKDELEAAQITYYNNVAQNTLIFDVLDPPVYPLRPKSPNRPLIAVVGLILGLGAGVGTVLILDFFDHSFRYTEEVSAALDVPVLGSIALIETLAERETARRKKKVAVAAVIVLMVAAGAAAVLQVTNDGLISSFLKDTVNLGG